MMNKRSHPALGYLAVLLSKTEQIFYCRKVSCKRNKSLFSKLYRDTQRKYMFVCYTCEMTVFDVRRKPVTRLNISRH